MDHLGQEENNEGQRCEEIKGVVANSRGYTEDGKDNQTYLSVSVQQQTGDNVGRHDR